jgi:hypothetical protein
MASTGHALQNGCVRSCRRRLASFPPWSLKLLTCSYRKVLQVMGRRDHLETPLETPRYAPSCASSS